MRGISHPRLRTLSAVFASALGLLMVASLWLRPLDPTALWLVVMGGAYLFIALGLFGRSHLSLYLCLAAPVIGFAFRPDRGGEQLLLLDLLTLLGTCTLATLCAMVLWLGHGLVGNTAQQGKQPQQVEQQEDTTGDN